MIHATSLEEEEEEESLQKKHPVRFTFVTCTRDKHLDSPPTVDLSKKKLKNKNNF
jgi:hypothetical protein